jgi:hypothetical protein
MIDQPYEPVVSGLTTTARTAHHLDAIAQHASS